MPHYTLPHRTQPCSPSVCMDAHVCAPLLCITHTRLQGCMWGTPNMKTGWAPLQGCCCQPVLWHQRCGLCSGQGPPRVIPALCCCQPLVPAPSQAPTVLTGESFGRKRPKYRIPGWQQEWVLPSGKGNDLGLPVWPRDTFHHPLTPETRNNCALHMCWHLKQAASEQ